MLHLGQIVLQVLMSSTSYRSSSLLYFHFTWNSTNYSELSITYHITSLIILITISFNASKKDFIVAPLSRRFPRKIPNTMENTTRPTTFSVPLGSTINPAGTKTVEGSPVGALCTVVKLWVPLLNIFIAASWEAFRLLTSTVTLYGSPPCWVLELS